MELLFGVVGVGHSKGVYAHNRHMMAIHQMDPHGHQLLVDSYWKTGQMV